ncbi:MAG: amino acid racemase, partial [candidate division NC10 bacterium]|nr:amino acid racemase [candidate division NC10 bacterium]
GGMGPAATADFYQKLIQATPAKADQDHFKVLIFSNPHIPDRTAAIRGEGPSPLPALIESAELLVRGGAAFIAIPCVTVHFFHAELQAALPIPVLHIVGETAAAVRRDRSDLRRLGLLATTGTVQSRLFEKQFEPHGLSILSPEPSLQEGAVMPAIYGVKHGEGLDEPRRLIREAAAHLVAQGAEAVIAGCTEVPLILQDGDLPAPVIDPTLLLAQASVQRALRGCSMASQRCYKDRG